MPTRCFWCDATEKMIKYHDEEWGIPVHDDKEQFEFLMMEVMQCGLNWNMMIEKREAPGKKRTVGTPQQGFKETGVPVSWTCCALLPPAGVRGNQ